MKPFIETLEPRDCPSGSAFPVDRAGYEFVSAQDIINQLPVVAGQFHPTQAQPVPAYYASLGSAAELVANAKPTGQLDPYGNQLFEVTQAAFLAFQNSVYGVGQDLGPWQYLQTQMLAADQSLFASQVTTAPVSPPMVQTPAQPSPVAQLQSDPTTPVASTQLDATEFSMLLSLAQNTSK